MKHLSEPHHGWAAHPRVLYLLLAIPVWLFCTWSAFRYQAPLVSSWGADWWEHAAALHAWMQDIRHPGSPHLGTDESSPRYMPYYLLITLLARLMGLDAIQAMALAGTINITLLLLFVPLFANRYFRNPHAGTFTLGILLFGWGAAWKWSNVYQLSDLPYVIAYPSFFVFSVSFLAFWVMLRYVRNEGSSLVHLAALALLSALMFASHPLTGASTLMGLGLMALLEPGPSWKTRMGALLALGAGSVLVELWPWFSTWQVVLGKGGGQATWISQAAVGAESRLSRIANHPFYDPKQVVISLGPTLLALPLMVWYLAHRRHLFLVASAAALLLVYVANMFIQIPLGHRFLLLSVFYLHLLIVGWLVDLVTADSARLKLAYGFIGLLALPSMVLTLGEVMGYSLRPNLVIAYLDKDKPDIPSHMRLLASYINDDSIVLAHDALGWPIPAFKGKVVHNFHINPLIADRLQRARDVERFFAAGTSNEQRNAIVKRYRVSHVFYNPRHVDAAVLAYLAGVCQETHDIHELRLCRIKRL